MRAILFIALVLFSLTVSGQGVRPALIGASRIVAADGGGYLIEEGFEGTGLPPNFTAIETGGTPDFDFDYTTTPLVGSQSFRMVDTTAGQEKVVVDFGARDEVWVAFVVNAVDGIPGGGGSYPFGFRDASGTEQNYLINENTPGRIKIHTDAGFTASSDFSFTTGGTYYVKVRYKKGTGNNAEMELWVSTSTASWGTSASSTDGDTTTQLRYFIFDSYNTYDVELKVDKLVIDDADIPITYFQ